MARPKRRPIQHIMEDASFRLLRETLPEEWVIRDYRPDYGIDLAVELFKYIDNEHKVAETLGETLFLQLKSIATINIETVRVFSRGNVAKGALNEKKESYLDIDVIKFQLDTTELFTIETMGHGTPVLLVLACLNVRRLFFVCLNDLIDKVIIPEDPDYGEQGTKTLFVPIRNELGTLVGNTALRFYAKRSKLFAAFNVFEYQRNELHYAYGSPPEAVAALLQHFIRLLDRLDIWDNSVEWGWGLVGWYREQLDNWKIALERYGPAPEVLADAARIWTGLVALSHNYEEICREWFLPTDLSQYLSYPDRPEDRTKF
jgi:hypothetical protein